MKENSFLRTRHMVLLKAVHHSDFFFLLVFLKSAGWKDLVWNFPAPSRAAVDSSLHNFIPKSPAFASEVREESMGQQGVAEKTLTLNSLRKTLTPPQLHSHRMPNLRLHFLVYKIGG